MSVSPSDEVLTAYDLDPAAVTVTALTSGHINATFKICGAVSPPFILQRLNPIFQPEVNLDIEAITGRLALAGLLTPRLRRTTQGQLWWTEDAAPQGKREPGVWRCMSFIDGTTLERVPSVEHCVAAATLLAEFHRSLWQVDYCFHGQRLGVHDTARHCGALRQALGRSRGHPLHNQAAELGAQLLRAVQELEADPQAGLCAGLPQRIVHGDPKISNMLFAADATGPARALCMIDLDTIAPMMLPLELGDAFRSWCALGDEDHAQATAGVEAFSSAYFAAGVAAYLATMGDRLTSGERRGIVPAIEQICLELAIRFCADIINESYFGWDDTRYPGAAQHNLARSRSQWALASSVRRQRQVLESSVLSLES